ncbi:DUF1611 domain-containing protein [Halalkalirubrum salinum]|uniref:DUF1611 domain-containing protein n=1 Tax=Halalkalirubrum salinum TaxID=2563889 RepID=UPI0010FB0EB1|nr:DUF1611 domain-containing protein [Halalkalirubrum salinum]
MHSPTNDGRRLAILAHEKFPERAKTALGVMRYADDEIVAVLDHTQAGTRVTDHVPDVRDAPIVDSFEAIEEPVDALLIGIAPIGGGFEERWRPDVRAAIEAGCDVIAGLHYFLNDDKELAPLAAEHGVDLVDVRKPKEDLTVAKGVADEVDAHVALTVGTDCSVGKMTVALETVHAAQAAGIDAALIPTGQTGIMIEGWGNPIDRVISDFTAGAVEEMILEIGDDHDLLVVEGQGTIIHPAYSAVTCGILHGSMADSLILCHVAGREAIHGYEDVTLPPIDTYVNLYESLAEPLFETSVVAGALNTRSIETDTEAVEAVDAFAEELGVPATDPVRFNADAIVEAITE